MVLEIETFLGSGGRRGGGRMDEGATFLMADFDTVVSAAVLNPPEEQPGNTKLKSSGSCSSSFSKLRQDILLSVVIYNAIVNLLIVYSFIT